jgi:hypothetical protein
MLALLLCESRECCATFEAEGTREAIGRLRCADCGGPLQATGWADAEPRGSSGREAELRRAA